MGKKNKKNYLLEKIVGIFATAQKGKVLDLGCGDGDYAKKFPGLIFLPLFKLLC